MVRGSTTLPNMNNAHSATFTKHKNDGISEVIKYGISEVIKYVKNDRKGFKFLSHVFGKENEYIYIYIEKEKEMIKM